MALKDFGLLDFDEPFSNFYAHGLIIAEGAKMSKSHGNIIIPDEYIRKYGADTLRTYLMFLGPFDMGGDFRDTGIAGMYRFLGRVWRLASEVILVNPAERDASRIRKGSWTSQDDELTRVMHHTIKEVTEDLENFRYNTAIAHIMEFVNALTDNRQLITENHIKSLLLMLAPFAPHMMEELSQRLSAENSKFDPDLIGTKFFSIHLHPWPSYDPNYLVEDEVTIIVQVNGKLRDTLQVTRAKSKEQNFIEGEARKSEKVKKYIAGKTIKKTIFVPGKLINFEVI
jgi:leucyl-tRNA synthetase